MRTNPGGSAHVSFTVNRNRTPRSLGMTLLLIVHRAIAVSSKKNPKADRDITAEQKFVACIRRTSLNCLAKFNNWVKDSVYVEIRIKISALLYRTEQNWTELHLRRVHATKSYNIKYTINYKHI